MKARITIAAALLAAIAGRVLADGNPFDGYAFWLPCGELKFGDAKSEKEFQVKRNGDSVSFVVHPRRTRFDVPRGQMVVVGDISPAGEFGAWTSFVSGPTKGMMTALTFLPREATEGRSDVPITVRPASLRPGRTLRFYWTDDSDKLGIDLSTSHLPSTFTEYPAEQYLQGLFVLFFGEPGHDRGAFADLAKAFKTPGAQRLCRRMVRWCDAKVQFKKIKTGPGYYNLGLYCMMNGFWDLAEASFRQATLKMPMDPDAWYMLADAVSYKISDLDTRMELVYPYYKKAAELYPRTNSNTFRTFFGFFRNLRVKDGDKTTVLHMSDDQIAYAEKAWAWCSAIMEGASHGALRMVNTYRVYDREFDGTNDWDSRPFNGLFEPGTVDTFIKMTGWGASDTCGMDCGPDRSAFINLGIREWDVMLHEWNHSLDWQMVSTELGIGVPETHASDWCGYEPIPSMGMGHHSINRYYMTPGMYRIVRGSDPATTPFVTDWAVGGPFQLVPDVADPKKIDDAYNQSVVDKALAVRPPNIESLKSSPKVEEGYVDLKATWPDAPNSAYAFAKCYVYSPKKQTVRMWLGADHNIRVWLNGKPVHKGLYWCVALFLGTRTKDQLSSGLLLQKGWNSLMVQVSSCQHGPDSITNEVPPARWGVSVRFCTSQNRLVPGLKWRSTEPAGFKTPVDFVVNPKQPKTYRWGEVADDYTSLLPALSLADLRAITGYRSLKVTNEMFFDLSGETLEPKVAKAVLAKSDPKNVALNNELNWFFSPKENAAVVRFRRGGRLRDLVFLRPEGYEPFLRMMRITPEAMALGIHSHLDQVVGYFTVPQSGCANGRIVLVLDTCLGGELPIDEEDLLDIRSLK